MFVVREEVKWTKVIYQKAYLESELLTSERTLCSETKYYLNHPSQYEDFYLCWW